MDEWAEWEGCGAEYNPLATTQPGFDELRPDWNDLGVKRFRDLDHGVRATATTMTNGLYQEILEILAKHEIRRPERVASQLRTWGTMGFATAIQQGWHPAPIDPTETIIGASQRIITRLEEFSGQLQQLNEGTLERFGLVQLIVTALSNSPLWEQLAAETREELSTLARNIADPYWQKANVPG